MASTPTRRVALAAAISLLGDSTLYVVLPLAAKDLGLSGLEVGVLLSANRFARLLFNGPTGVLVQRLGAARPLAAALALAALTTIATGVCAGPFWPLLLVRIAWGLAWSIIRHAANAAVIAEGRERFGAAQGTFRSISRVGSLVAVLGGSWAVSELGFARGFGALGLLTLPGIPIALAAFAGHDGAGLATAGYPRFLGSSLGSMRIAAGGFLLNGFGASLLVATASARVRELTGGAATGTILGVTLAVVKLAGVVGSSRWVAEVVAAPLGGGLSDRLGRARVGLVGTLLAVAALVACARAEDVLGYLVASVGAFLALSILQSALDGLATDRAARGERAIADLGSYFTWVDVGTAVGPLVASRAVTGEGGLRVAHLLVAAAVFLPLAALLAFFRIRPDNGVEERPAP